LHPEKEVSQVNRPDLEEFLSALDGFLGVAPATTAKEAPADLRFLEIFCRSVGAGMGHMLIQNASGLKSVMSFGFRSKFDDEFNAVHSVSAAASPCPLDQAFLQKKVIAIIDLERAKQKLPDWFTEIMNRHKFQSLVAVPLLGPTSAMGILCAYYQDVCLFDQGTLDRLTVMGRMVGAAMEKASQPAPPPDVREKATDAFLTFLNAQPFTKIQIFGFLTKVLLQCLRADGLISGPVKKADGEFVITIVSGAGIPGSEISGRFVLPPFLMPALVPDPWPNNAREIKASDLGDFRRLISGDSAMSICYPLFSSNKLQGAVIAWREKGPAFSEAESALLSRMGAVASLGLATN